MHIAGIILGSVVILVVGVAALLLIIDNTRVLNERKALHVELDDIQRECDAIGSHPTDEQVAALNARIDHYRKRFDTFRASPFVISNTSRRSKS